MYCLNTTLFNYYVSVGINLRKRIKTLENSTKVVVTYHIKYAKVRIFTRCKDSVKSFTSDRSLAIHSQVTR